MTQTTAEQRAELRRLIDAQEVNAHYRSDYPEHAAMVALLNAGPALLADAEALAEREDTGVWLSDQEASALASIVCEWIDEGFTTPPYPATLYRVIDRLGIRPDDVQQYDIRPPTETDADAAPWWQEWYDRFDVSMRVRHNRADRVGQVITLTERGASVAWDGTNDVVWYDRYEAVDKLEPAADDDTCRCPACGTAHRSKGG